MSGEPPVFLVGAERSGSTLLRLMLGRHPRLAWCQEFEYAVDLVGDDGALPAPDRYAAWLGTHRVFKARGYDIDPSLDYPALVTSFLDQQREREGKERVGATLHRHFGRVLCLWPEARFIHLVRDPRDVARSVMVMGWTGNVYCGAGYWIEAEEEWDRLSEGLPEDRYAELRFEDLVADPEGELTRLCALMGIDYDPAMLRYPEGSSYGPPNPALTRQWKKKLGRRDVRRVEAATGDLLRRRGYEESGHPPLSISAPERLWLAARSRWGRMAFRLRRYGFRLWAASVLAKRFGGPEWRGRVRLRLNEIDTLHLK